MELRMLRNLNVSEPVSVHGAGCIRTWQSTSTWRWCWTPSRIWLTLHPGFHTLCSMCVPPRTHDTMVSMKCPACCNVDFQTFYSLQWLWHFGYNLSFLFECQKFLEPNRNVHGSCIFSFQVMGGDSWLVLSCVQREWFVDMDIVIKRAIEAGEGICKEGGM